MAEYIFLNHLFKFLHVLFMSLSLHFRLFFCLSSGLQNIFFLYFQTWRKDSHSFTYELSTINTCAPSTMEWKVQNILTIWHRYYAIVVQIRLLTYLTLKQLINNYNFITYMRIYFNGFVLNSNSCTANKRNRRIQISSQWWLRKCNPYFIRPILRCNGQLLIQPSCTISCTFGWVNRMTAWVWDISHS